MGRSAQVKEVYAELRRAIGDQASQKEVLECAALIVKMSADPQEEKVIYEDRPGGRPFGRWDLDTAFADGGWRVLNYETRLEEYAMRVENTERLIQNGQIKHPGRMVA